MNQFWLENAFRLYIKRMCDIRRTRNKLMRTVSLTFCSNCCSYIQKGPIQISISKIDSNFKQKYDAIRSEEHPPDIQIFDLFQQEAFRLLNKSPFQNFLQSDDYITHIANATGAGAGAGAGCVSTSDSSGSGSAQLTRSALPTVVEDQELSINRDDLLHTGEGTPMRLTKELLLLSQQRRLEARPPA